MRMVTFLSEHASQEGTCRDPLPETALGTGGDTVPEQLRAGRSERLL